MTPAYADPELQAKYEEMLAALERAFEADETGAEVFAKKARLLTIPVSNITSQ